MFDMMGRLVVKVLILCKKYTFSNIGSAINNYYLQIHKTFFHH